MSEPEIEKHGLPVNPKKSNHWIWVFATISLLTAAGVTIMLAYNHFQQLSPEQLHSAWDVWKENGPKSYQMTITKRFKPNDVPVKYKVTVQDSKVTDVKEASIPYDVEMTLDPAKTDYANYSMDGMFRDLERFLEVDKQYGKKFTKVVFQMKGDGRILEFVRVLNQTDRLQVMVEELEPLVLETPNKTSDK